MKHQPPNRIGCTIGLSNERGGKVGGCGSDALEGGILDGVTSLEGGQFRVRSLATVIYLPNLLFAVGRGAVVPLIALVALDLGASPVVAGVVVALRGAGTMVFDLPAGILIARVGEKRAMILAAAALAGISLGIWLRPPLWLYALLIVLLGCTWSVWHIARIAFASGSSTVRHRGRVMAMMGGATRIGLLIGPLLASLVITGGDLTNAFLLLAIVSAAAAGAMAVAGSVPFVSEAHVTERPTLRRIVKEHRHTLLTAGSVAFAAQVLRSSREVLIPLWGDEVGITATTIPLIFAASYALETVMFYPVGLIMDRRGRKWTFIPCVALLSVGIASIPLASDTVSLTAVAVLLGIANGFGSGMNMTLGSDLSPLAGRSRFLGIWRLVTDVGSTGGPLLVAALTSAATLAVAAVSVGGVGLMGLLVLWRLVPETLVTSED